MSAKAGKVAKKRVKAGTSKTAAAERRALFVEAYLTNSGNATQAAIIAGYSEKSARRIGTRLSTDAHIRTELDRRRAEVIAKVEKKTEVTKEWITASLKTVAERCMQAAPVLDRKGEPVLTETPNGTLAVAFEFNSAGANRALELLGKEQGMFIDRKEIGDPGAFERLDDDELTRAELETEKAIAVARASSAANSKTKNPRREKSPRAQA